MPSHEIRCALSGLDVMSTRFPGGRAQDLEGSNGVHGAAAPTYLAAAHCVGA